MSLKCLVTTFLIICTAVPTLTASGSAWLTDYETALGRAKKEDRPLLVDFSGSDWCGWCIRLDKEVFKKPAFQAWAKKTVVLCLLDFPAKPGMVTAAQRKKNQAIAEKFNVRGYPTVLLVEPDGSLIARTGYLPGGAEAYTKQLDTLLANCRGWKARFESLPTLQGPAKIAAAAKLFKHSADALGEKVVTVAEILFRHDKEDSSGHRADAALIVAGVKSPLAKTAEAYLKSIAKTDPKKRYGFLIFTRTEEDFRHLIETAEQKKGHELSDPDIRKAAAKLYKRLKVARAYVPNDEMKANIYLRFAVALGCVGKMERAKKALLRAKKLGVPSPVCKGYRDFISKLRK